MPKLAIYEATLLMNGIHNTFPGVDVFLSIDLRSAHPASCKLRDLGALGDDKAGRCALRVVLNHQIVGKGVLNIKGNLQ
jgi:hypothetical protein